MDGARRTVVSLRRRFVRSLHTRNEFLTVDAALREGIERVLADALREAAGLLRGGRYGGEHHLPGLLFRHRRALRRLLAEARGDLPERVPCAQYDPAVQLAAPGLEGAALSEPVLDLGCGEDARPVRALHPGGLFAYAPGLPFFEPHLERSGYRVGRIPLLAEIRGRLPPEAACAAHVHRPGRLPFC